MGTRALRKLREQEWERQLAAAREQDEQPAGEDDDDEPVVVSKTGNAFDMLNDAEEHEGESDDEESTVPTTIPLPSSSSPQSSTPTGKSSKKKKKKAKKKPRDAVGTPQQAESKDVSEDEIDKALKELARKQPAEHGAETLSSEDIWMRSISKMLASTPRNFDPVNEMRGLFGNIALEDESRSRTQSTRRRDQPEHIDLETALTGRYNRASHGKELGSLARRRNCFVQGKEQWPLATSGGLSMEALPAAGYEEHFNIVHSALYKEAQWNFKLAVESMQAEAMIAMLQKYPYHIASLLQVSEIAKHQGDASLSGDLLQRALYTFGRSVNSAFPPAIQSGVARLSFDKPANRELYLTVWRYIRNLEQRGTWKTAFEWSKLLLQFDPRSDPFGVTLMIDQLALRGRQHEQLLAMTSEETFGNTWSHLPNINISRALALLRANKPRDARQQLALSMHRYPYVLSALASALEVSPMPKSLWGKLPSTDAEKLYTELYVTRAKDLWNTPETIGLISEVANTLQYYKAFVEAQPTPPKPQISLEEARHVMALEIPALIALLPRKFTTMPTSSSDILPPPNSESSDLVRRGPADGPGAADGPGLVQVGNDLVNRVLGWFLRPAADPRSGDFEAPAEDIAALREQLGPEAATVPDEVLQQMIQEQMAAEFGAVDEEDLRRAIAGGWDYYDDAARNGHSDDSDDMPELVDIEDPNSSAGAAMAGEIVEEPNISVSYRSPHAATVEEAEDEDDEPRPAQNAAATTGPVLRRVDEDEAPAVNFAQPSPAVSRLPTAAAPPAPPVAAARPVATDEDIESDPQRLQRWLISTGLEELKQNSNMSTYVRRLKMLNKNQQTWILSVVRQRGSGDLATKVQNAL